MYLSIFIYIHIYNTATDKRARARVGSLCGRRSRPKRSWKNKSKQMKRKAKQTKNKPKQSKAN